MRGTTGSQATAMKVFTATLLVASTCAQSCSITQFVCNGQCVGSTTNCCSDAGEYPCTSTQQCCGGTCCSSTDNCCGDYCVGMMEECTGTNSGTSSGSTTTGSSYSSSTTTTTTGSSTTSTSSTSSSSESAVTGSIVSILLVLAVVGGIVYCCWKKKRNHQPNREAAQRAAQPQVQVQQVHVQMPQPVQTEIPVAMPVPKKMIFLSYKQNDNSDALAMNTHHTLDKKGIDVWLDKMRGEERSESGMVAGVKSCHLFLALISPAYFDSAFCMLEMKTAMENGKKICVAYNGSKFKVQEALGWIPEHLSSIKREEVIMLHEDNEFIVVGLDKIVKRL